jgi:hypothetical protein
VSQSSAWSAFWRAYQSAGHRERPSLFRRNEYPGVGVSIESIFAAVVRMCDRLRQMPRAQRIIFSNIRFYIDGQRIQDPTEYLMRKEDGDFVGWHSRLEAVTNDYCVVFNRLESAFDDISDICELLRPLLDELGAPARKSQVTLFAGRYKRTPFGIHNDDELNFFWPLIGPKRLRFWEPEYGNTNPGLARLVEYNEHLSQSLLLDADAGDMLAWPGSWWHIAEGGDQFSASLTIPLEWYSSREKIESGELLEKLAKIVFRTAAADSGSTLIPMQTDDDTAERLPEMIFDAARLFGGIRAEDISDLLAEKWLRQITTAGLDVARPVRNNFVNLEQAQMMRLTDGGTIRWTKLSRGKICIASGGRAVRLPHSAALVEVIREINTSKPFSVGSLAEQISGKTNDHSALAVTKFALTVLAKIGAVEPVC